MRVRVERLDIRAGFREDCEACPLALALHRALGYPVNVLGGGDVVAIPGGRAIGRLPRSAREFMADFDARKPVRPFEFRIHLAPRDVRGDEPAG